MSGPLDTAGPVRPGEALDEAKLEAFLRNALGLLDGPLAIEQYRNGHSNLTYLIHLGPRELVLRRPPFASRVKSAHDMSREYRVLSRLCEVYPQAPRPVLFCEDQSVLGAPFYLMQRIKGQILRGKPPEGVTVSPETARACCLSFVRNLAVLHGIDYQAVGLAELHRPGNYTERQVLGWAERYQKAKTDEIPSIDAAIAWLEERIPEDTGTVLIHNDYKFDNLVLDPDDWTRIIGVLDWEMTTVGDPLMDLGTSLGYWAEATDPEGLQGTQCFLTSLPGSLTRAQLVEEYSRLTGRDTSNMLFYYIFSLVKIAGIVQQIYYRYVTGSTKDERFRGLIFVVGMLGQMAGEALEKNRF
jgi:aminoglycoside phosphotransferase (APT) family kinase protein